MKTNGNLIRYFVLCVAVQSFFISFGQQEKAIAQIIHERDSAFQLAIDTVGFEQLVESECGDFNHYLKWKENVMKKIGPHGTEGDYTNWLKSTFDNPLPLREGSGPWKELGPYQQPINSPLGSVGGGLVGIGPLNFISFDPNYASTQLVFTGGWYSGLWYSRNGGDTWQNGGTDQIGPLASAAHCVSSHLDDNVWFMCTGQGDGHFNNGPWQSARSSGIYRTLDGGETWECIGQADSGVFSGEADFFDHDADKPYQIKKLLIDPSSGQNNLTIYATHTGGIIRCTNAMAPTPTWEWVYEWSGGLGESEQAHTACWYPNMGDDGQGNTAAWAYDIEWVPAESGQPCCTKLVATVSKICRGDSFDFGSNYWEQAVPSGANDGVWYFSSAILVSQQTGNNSVGSWGTWSELSIPQSLRERGRISISMSPANTDVLWAWGVDKTATPYIANSNRLYRYQFSTGIWADTGIQAINWIQSTSSHMHAADGLAVSPLNANLVYFPDGGPNGVGGPGISRYNHTSQNYFHYANGNQSGIDRYHDDVEHILFSPDGTELWLATHGGISVYDLDAPGNENDAVRWTTKSQGLGIAEVDGMANPVKKKGKILIGLFHNGSQIMFNDVSEGQPTQWNQVGDGDGQKTMMNEDNYLVSYVSNQSQTIRKNINGWSSSSASGIAWGGAGANTHGTTSFFDGNQIFVERKEIYRHDNGGESIEDNWVVLSDFASENATANAGNILASHTAPNLIFTNIDFEGLLESQSQERFHVWVNNRANEGATAAQNAWLKLPFPAEAELGLHANGLQSDWRDANVFYMLSSYYNPWWQSGPTKFRFLKYEFVGSGNETDLATFDFSTFTGDPADLFEITDLTRNFPKLNGQSMYMNRGSQDVFVGTPLGVYHSTIDLLENENETEPWKLYGANLPHCETKFLNASLPADVLRAGVHGRGIWEIPLPCEKLEEEVIISSGETQTWERFYRFRQDVIVKNNAQLTIKGDVYMGAECRIIVEPGGKLILDGGTVTNACGELWLGIEVWGNDAVVQNSNNQGVVELKNGAVIENAHAGIWVRQNDDECQYVEGSGGGIVRARDSEIRNCYVGVEFAPYSWIVNGNPATNQSYFTNMTFKQTQPLNNDMLFKAHVILNEVHKMPFKGCRFKDEVPQNSEYASYYPEGWKNMGIGIDSRSSTFIVDRKCDGSLDPSGTCSGNWIPSEFENLAYGIKATDGLGIHPFAVRHSQFRDNVTDIYGSGMDIGPSIALNSFDKKAITVNTISPWKVVGVVLEETEGYEVEENTFNGDTSQNPSGQQLVGAAFVHTGPVANECYKNTFNGVTVAAHAQGVNGVYSQNNTEIEGLQFLCNQFGQTEDNELADIQVTDDSRVAVSQGENDQLNVAGNLFSHLCPGGTGASDIVLGVNSVGNEYNMYYHYGSTALEEPLCVSSGVEKIEVQGGFNSCPSELSFTGTKIQAAQVKSTLTPILDDVVALYNGLRDGGNPSGLVAYINNANHSSIEVRNEMMNCGPYVSLSAWQAAFTRTPAMDPWHLAQVLFLNTPLHPDVKRMMDHYNFDPYYEELVLNGQNGGITHMQIMESDISALTGQIRSAEQDYMRLAVLWEEDTTRWDEVMTFIGTDMHRQRLKAAIHLARGEYTQANNVLGGLPQNQSKGGVLDILLAAEQANQFCPKFTTGQRSDLEYLAANEDAPGHSTARALLLQETGAEYDTELYFPLNPRNLMLKKPRSEIPMFMKIHPNPTRDLVYVTFRMPAGDVRAELEIVDNLGKTVYKADVSQNKGLVELALKQIGSGTFICTLRFDGQVVDSQKLSVLK